MGGAQVGVGVELKHGEAFPMALRSRANGRRGDGMLAAQHRQEPTLGRVVDGAPGLLQLRQGGGRSVAGQLQGGKRVDAGPARLGIQLVVVEFDVVGSIQDGARPVAGSRAPRGRGLVGNRQDESARGREGARRLVEAEKRARKPPAQSRQGLWKGPGRGFVDDGAPARARRPQIRHRPVPAQTLSMGQVNPSSSSLAPDCRQSAHRP